jgi:SAM-dependent methyltransferase
MRLIDCGCGPGSITIDIARIVAPGEVVGIDRRQASLSDARTFARERGVANVAFEVANVYQLPFPDRSFDAAFACALLQHLAAPLAALKEIRRVLKPGGVIGIVDGSSTITFRYPRNRLLEAWDRLRALQRAYNTGRPAEPLLRRRLSGLLSPGFEDQVGDFVGMGDQCEMARLHLDGLGAHALGHEALEVRVDRAVLGRNGVIARL